MASERPKTESGAFRALPPSPETLELQEIARRMFLSQKPEEIVRLLTEAAVRRTGARAATVFLRNPETGGFEAGDPALLPETAVIDYVFHEDKPPTIPHGTGIFITVFPLRFHEEQVGLLVLDVTAVAEEIVRKDLDPILLLADQAAVALKHARLVGESLDESILLANILDSITNSIITLDSENRITRVNRNAMAMLDLGEEVVGRPYREVLLPPVAEAIDSLIREARQVGFAMERMVAARFPNGLELNIAVSTSVLRDKTSLPLGMIVVLRDMTASRELERLRRLDEMKSEFVANVSHELKTPLTSIKAYTEALLDMVPEGQMRGFLKVIEEESDRLLYLINDLLNVARIQSGRMKLHFALAAPRSIVEEILTVSKLASDKHRIVLEIAGGLPEILLDKERMKEVLVNLLSNAIKYSPAGGEVRVRMRLEESNLRIEVQDQGLGISPENQQKLFQPFSRVDSSLTAGIPGTGLGLVIVKSIVELHGGRITVESEPGRGATFIILIPARREIRRGEIGSEIGTMAE